MRIALITAATLLLSPPLLRAAEADLVKAELFTDAAEVRPGQPFTAFVRMTIADAWHIYWKNPGDSGQATRVDWVLPEGFAASELLYPVPSLFSDIESSSFGYAGTVVLMARITPGPNAGNLKDGSLGANISWLRCSNDVCVPGRANLRTPLPASADLRKAAAELARTWLARIPADPPAGDLVITGALDTDAAGGSSGQFEMRLRGLKDANNLKDLAFFPGVTPALAIEKTRIRREEGVLIVAFNARVLKGMKLSAATLPCVLGYTDPTGERRGINVIVPLTPAR